MAKKHEAKGKVTVSVRLTPELHNRLRKIADKTDRSMSWHIERTLDDAIDAIEREVNAVAEGMKAAREGRGRDALEVLDQIFTELKKPKGRRARKAG